MARMLSKLKFTHKISILVRKSHIFITDNRQKNGLSDADIFKLSAMTDAEKNGSGNLFRPILLSP